MKYKKNIFKLGLLAATLLCSAHPIAASSPPVVMKVLLVSNSPDDLGYLSISSYLDQLGTPYQTLFLNSLTLDASGNRLSGVPLTDSATGNGLYQGIIQTDSSFSVCSSTCQSQLSSADWAKLTNYEIQYSVRAVAYYSYPDPQWGLVAADGGAGYSETNPLNVTLTSAGSAVFPYLNPANPIPVGGRGTANMWAYRALPTAAANETTTPLMMAGSYTVAVAHTTADGRETMALTMDNYPGLMHSTAFSYGVINWVTKGVFLGSRRIYLNTQIDDLLLGNRLYAPTLPQCPNDPSCPTIFATGQDLQALAAWQSTLHHDAQFESFHATFAYNGIGTTWFPATDPIYSAISSLNTQFHWVSHTWDHSDLDCFTRDTNGVCVPATLSESLSELNQDIDVAPSLGITLDRQSMVTPFNGGLTNPNFMQAAAQAGLQYIVTAVDPPGANLGIMSPLAPIFQIPRRGNNLFDDVSSPETGVYGSWPDEYNARYGPTGTQPLFTQNQTYSQIIEIESQKILQNNMMTYEPYPLGYHIDNSSAYDGTHSMFSDLMDAAIAKYKKIFTLPVVTIDMGEIAPLLMNRASFNASGVTGVYTPGVGVTLTTQQTATIPITGACLPATCSTYGGQIQDSVPVPANSTINLSLTPSQGAILTSLSVNPTSVTGGTSSAGNVTLSAAAPSGGATVNLTSSSSMVTVPASVLITAGSSTGSFSMTTGSSASASSAVITAEYNGSSKTTTLTVQPALTITLSSVVVSPASLTGGTSATGTLTLSAAAPTGGVSISVSSSSPSIVPASTVVVPSGSTTASFSITTSLVTSPTSVILTATYNSSSKTTALTVNPSVVVTISSVGLSATSVVGGSSTIGTITLSGPAPTGGVAVNLASNNAAAAVPASVTVAAGTTTATFAVTTASVTTSTSVVLTASYSGNSKTNTLTVVPATVAALSSLSVSSSNVKGGTTVTGTITLTAPAPAGGATISLKTSNTLVTGVPVSLSIPAGVSTATFSITTRSLLTTWNVTLTATYKGISKTTALTVTL